MASTMGFSLLFALFLVTAVAARQAPSGEEKAYAPPYGSDPTPSGASPVVPTPTPPTTPTEPTPPTPTTPTDPTPVTPTDPVPTTPTTPTTPTNPTNPTNPTTPTTPYTPTPTTPSDPAPVTPADPIPTPTTPYTPVPVTPTDPLPTPTTPYTPDPISPVDPLPPPAASTPGTCTWWSSHTSSFPDIVSIFSTIIDLFGTITGGSGSGGTGVTSTIASIFGGQLTVTQSLTNTRNDGFGALARQGSAALLNSLTRRDYPYSAFQVKTQFRNSLQSQQQAFATAKLFENANIALGAGRH